VFSNIAGIKSRYEAMTSAREPFLRRARAAALVTIPSLVLPSGSNSTSNLAMPNQSFGARGVKNLASKFLSTVLPPNSSFFRQTISDSDIEESFSDPSIKPKVEEALSKMEREILLDIESSNIRTLANEMFQQLLVAGNVLVQLLDTGGMRLFLLEQYVVKRTPDGRPIEIIVHESIDKRLLSEDVRQACSVAWDEEDKLGKAHGDDNVSVYTQVYRESATRWRVHQEINDIMVPGSQGSYVGEYIPWLPLGLIPITNQDYARSHVEELYGDLKSYDTLSKAIVRGSAIMAKVVFLLDPNGSTRAKALTTAESGDVITGRDSDVTVLQVPKQADFSVVQQEMGVLREQLSYAFLLNTSIQRDAERVTAEEIRYMAGELEDARGGAYAMLAQQFQLPLVKITTQRLVKSGKLPSLPDDSIKPTITTGLEALGRGQDLNKLNTFLQNIQPLGPEVIGKYLNVSGYISSVSTALSLDANGLVKSEEQIQQEEQQAAMLQAMQSGVPNATKQLLPNIELPGAMNG
jgi:hypothetical protein